VTSEKYRVISSGTIIQRKSVATAGAIKARGSSRFMGGFRGGDEIGAGKVAAPSAYL
jgi:hypothetical protein